VSMSVPTVPPRGVIPMNEIKQLLSVAYLRMVAAAAGVATLGWDSDYDGVDVTLSSGADFGGRVAMKMDVQLKCTSSPSFVADNMLSWRLGRDKYLKLRAPKRYDVAMLAVLVIPHEDYDDWLSQDEERLLARSCMYYSLSDEWDHIADDAASKVVSLSRSRILNADAMNAALQHAADKDVFSW
jgi:hypothetical protein